MIVPDPYGLGEDRAIPVSGIITVPFVVPNLPVLMMPSSGKPATALVGSRIFRERAVCQVNGLRKAEVLAWFM